MSISNNASFVKARAAEDPEGAYRAAGFTGEFRKEGRNLVAHCPFHEDSHPSFKIALRDTAKIKAGHFKCFGCGASGSIIDFFLRVKGLPPDEPPPADVIAELAQRLGAKPSGRGRKPRAGTKQAREVKRQSWRILDADGKVLATHRRIDYADGNKNMWWERDGKKNLGDLSPQALPLYRLPELLAADPDTPVILCEGEKATDALAESDGQSVVAVGTVTGAAAIPGNEALRPLVGRRVFLWPDADEPGRKHMARIAAHLQALGATPKILSWPEAPEGGDAADFVAGGGTVEELQALMDAAQEPPHLAEVPQIGGKPNPLEYLRTDVGNAEYLAALHGERLRYDWRRDRWLLFEEHHWRPDRDAEIERLAKAAARDRLFAALDVDDDDNAKWALRSMQRPRIDAAVAMMRSELPIADTGDDWDPEPFLLGVPNGVVDLRDGSLRDGRPEDRITRQTAVPYDPHAEAPRWVRFLSEVLDDDELFEFLWRAAGYSITGDMQAQCFFILYGSGSNGKTVLLTTLRRVLGDYAANANFTTFEEMHRPSIPEDLAVLEGRRFIMASETGEASRLNIARIKAWTGGEPITARMLYGHLFEFQPQGKLWLCVNHRPTVNDQTISFWRRARMIPFRRTFTGKDMDEKLADKLMAEAPGILRWLVDGARLYQQEGLAAPEAVMAATREWKEETDPIAEFISECCVIDDGKYASAGELFAAYKRWAEAAGLSPRDRLSQKRFGMCLSERFVRRRGHGGVRLYDGVALKQPSEDTGG